MINCRVCKHFERYKVGTREEKGWGRCRKADDATLFYIDEDFPYDPKLMVRQDFGCIAGERETTIDGVVSNEPNLLEG